jgi:LysR family transcriptional regulator, glycine cleavage system transcriptional activator
MKFSRAAEELSVSPSAVSHQIRGLEDELGVSLFRRERRQLALTVPGQRLAAAAGETLARLCEAVEEVRNEVQAAPLTVSLRPYFALKWLSPRLGRFWQRHPDVELKLHHTNHPVNVDAQDIDLAIEWRPSTAVNANAVKLVEGDLTPVCHPGLLAGDPPLREPADLADHVLLHEENDDRWADWLALAGVEGLNPRQHVVIDDTNVRTQAAMDGQGVELGCPALIGDDLAAGRLAQPFETRLELFNYYLVAPPRARERAEVGAFRDWLIAEAGQTPA